MEDRLSERAAGLNGRIIGIFYLVSGGWEFLIGLTEQEAIPPGSYYFLDIYRNYASYLGLVTILIGIGILAKLNTARLFAITLALWNLLSAPIIYLWWHKCLKSIKEIIVIDSAFGLLIYSISLLILMSAIRIYIIYMLRISKAGYIFSKEYKGGQ